MEVEWDYGAQAVLDQLGRHQQALVTAAADRAAADWNGAAAQRVVLPGDNASVEYVLGAGADFRVFVRKSADRLTVVDVVPRKQFVSSWSEEPDRPAAHAPT